MPIPWTDRARKAIALAVQAAQQRGLHEVTPDLLLFGLLELPRSVAKDCLKSLSVDVEALQRVLAAGEGEGAGPSSDPPPFSPTSEAILQHAERLVERLRHDAAGTDALLVSILERADPTVSDVFRKCAVDLAQLRKQLAGMLHPRPARAAEGDKRKPLSFEEAVAQWEPRELLARVLAIYEREKQAAIHREDYATAALYRDRIRRLKGLRGEGPSPEK